MGLQKKKEGKIDLPSLVSIVSEIKPVCTSSSYFSKISKEF
jgi:hypothetical protein